MTLPLEACPIFSGSGYLHVNGTDSTSDCSGDSVSDEAYIAAIVLGFFRLLGKILYSFFLPIA